MHQDNQWPKYGLNKPDRHAYFLEEAPLFAANTPRRFRTWDEYIQAGPPPPPRRVEKLMVIAEDDAMFPVTWDPLPDLVTRHSMDEDSYEEAYQVAEYQAAREQMTSSLLSTFVIVCMGISVVAVLLIAVVFAQSQWGGSGTP